MDRLLIFPSEYNYLFITDEKGLSMNLSSQSD